MSTPKLPYSAGKYHLPTPSGQYPVISVHDIMTPGRDGVLLRLMYPAPNQALDVTSAHDQWPNWFPDPGYKQALSGSLAPGLGHVIRVFQRLGHDLYMPYLRDMGLLQGSGDSGWPIIIFTHGVSSMRTTYSNVCAHFASLGFVVAALEHRDDSALATMYPSETGNGFDWLPYRRFPSYGPFNGPAHFDARQKQLRYRLQEISATIKLLDDLNAGSKVKNVLAPNFDYSTFKGQLDTSSLIAAGHSFGGAGLLYALALEKRLKLGICVDAWMFPVKNIDARAVTQPLLFINLGNFQDDASLLKIKQFVSAKQEECEERKVFKIQNSRHTDVSDFGLLVQTYPRWVTGALNWMLPLNSKVNPYSVHGATVSLSTDFIKKHCPSDVVQRMTTPEFPPEVHLEEGIILKDPTLHNKTEQEMVEIGQENVLF